MSPVPSAPRQVRMEGKEALLQQQEDDDERFFARGPTGCCPLCKCTAVLCRCFWRDPIAWLKFPCRMKCSPTMCSPCSDKNARFASVFKNIRGLAGAGPKDILAMQAVTDVNIAMPWLGCCCHQMLGAGVDLSPASTEVMPTGLHGFVERGLWLFPKGQGRITKNRHGCRTDLCHRCSFCFCCCIGGLGGCDGTLEPPRPSENSKVIMYLHGGAFALTNAETYPWLLGYELVRRTGSVVLLPNFARPPHRKFGDEGSALEGCLRLYKRLLGLYGADNILIMGDSAGGNISLATLFAASEENLPPPAGLVLISPWVDLTEDGTEGTRVSNAEHDYLPEELIGMFRDSYCGGDCKQPLVSPLFAPDEMLASLPPTMLTYGTHEILRSQQEKLEHRLEAAGVLSSVYIASEMQHVSPLFTPVIFGAGTPANEPLCPAIESLQRIEDFARDKDFFPRVVQDQRRCSDCTSVLIQLT